MSLSRPELILALNRAGFYVGAAPWNFQPSPAVKAFSLILLAIAAALAGCSSPVRDPRDPARYRPAPIAYPTPR